VDFSRLVRQSEVNRAVVLLGPRRVGKTILVYHAIQDLLDGQQASGPMSAKPGLDPFVYFVQVGAFSKPEDAEQQRARLGLLGYTAKVTEREQSGRTMYRVRLGPYQLRGEAESAQAKLQTGGETAALVRVER